MDNKYPKQSVMKDQKTRIEKKDHKPSDKNEKNENKNDKVDRPVKWAKNKHTFVVAGN
jgi:hypothetical protein